jgi:DNA-directed RNA polymerase specialized sigma24 family protein
MSENTSPPPCDAIARALIRSKARQLVGTAGLMRQDRPDLEQALAAALLARQDQFDAARGRWPSFVRVVIDHAVADLLRARRAKKRPPPGLPSLEALPDEQREQPAGGGEEHRDLALDTAEAVARLPPELRELAGLILEEGTVAGAARRLGVARGSLARPLRQLRRRFERAGLCDYL